MEGGGKLIPDLMEKSSVAQGINPVSPFENTETLFSIQKAAPFERTEECKSENGSFLCPHGNTNAPYQTIPDKGMARGPGASIPVPKPELRECCLPV